MSFLPILVDEISFRLLLSSQFYCCVATLSKLFTLVGVGETSRFCQTLDVTVGAGGD